MPAPRPFLTTQHLHLMGKLLDCMDPEAMKDEGFTISERSGAAVLFIHLDLYLTDVIGEDWNDEEALV